MRNEELLRRYSETKSTEALHQLVLGNLRLVSKLAGLYVGYPGSCLTYEDLVAEGVIGLIWAIGRFDPDKQTQLSTYATWWIRQHMQRAIMNDGTIVRLPVHMHELIREVDQEMRELEAVGWDINEDVVCTSLGISPDQYRNARMARHRFLQIVSLDRSVGHGDGSFMDLLPGDSSVFASGPGGALSEMFCDPALLTQGADLAGRLRQVIAAKLTPREQTIIAGRFGLDGDRPKTLQKLGDALGVSRERIRQIEARALGRLRSALTRMGGSAHWR